MVENGGNNTKDNSQSTGAIWGRDRTISKMYKRSPWKLFYNMLLIGCLVALQVQTCKNETISKRITGEVASSVESLNESAQSIKKGIKFFYHGIGQGTYLFKDLDAVDILDNLPESMDHIGGGDGPRPQLPPSVKKRPKKRRKK